MIVVSASVYFKAQPAHTARRKLPNYKRVAGFLLKPHLHGADSACMEKLLLIVLMDKVFDIIIKPLPAVVGAVPFVKEAFAVKNGIGAG